MRKESKKKFRPIYWIFSRLSFRSCLSCTHITALVSHLLILSSAVHIYECHISTSKSNWTVTIQVKVSAQHFLLGTFVSYFHNILEICQIFTFEVFDEHAGKTSHGQSIVKIIWISMPSITKMRTILWIQQLPRSTLNNLAEPNTKDERYYR